MAGCNTPIYLCLLIVLPVVSCQNFPLVINTWQFSHAAQAAWDSLEAGKSRLDAVVDGCSQCEFNYRSCDTSVGWGGSPDETGETTLDAMIMDGASHDVGAVGCLRGIQSAIGVARAIMEYTTHTMLVGELATNFALEMGFEPFNLSSEDSIRDWRNWQENNCQPNFRQNVSPDPTTSCGPYSPNPLMDKSSTEESSEDSSSEDSSSEDSSSEESSSEESSSEESSSEESSSEETSPEESSPEESSPEESSSEESSSEDSSSKESTSDTLSESLRFKPKQKESEKLGKENSVNKWLQKEENEERYPEQGHDTIAMVVIDKDGNMAAGTSTNGAGNKVPGRVGDSPIVGAGAYVDRDVGGAGATGDGDIMMRFLPSLRVVELMRAGIGPEEAVLQMLNTIRKFYPGFSGAMVAVNKDGTYGAGCVGFAWFRYSLVSPQTDGEVQVIDVDCS